MGNRTLQIMMLCIVLCTSPGCLVIGAALLIRKINVNKQAREKGTAVDMQVQGSGDGVRPPGTDDGNDEQQTTVQP